MNNQGQHRVSQTYLKQFSFRNKNNSHVISVMELGNPITQMKYVKSFTKENNLFNLDLFNGRSRTLFEDNCQKIETHYPKLLKSLDRENILVNEGRQLLIQFIPSLLCRSVPFRKLVELLISNDITREKFFKEITTFEVTLSHLKTLKSLNKDLDLRFQTNFVMFSIMEFFLTALQDFSFVILKDTHNGGWITSDNPVFHDKQGNNVYTLPLESEFYFPLSPTYCLFVFYQKVKGTNILRKMEDKSINEIDTPTYELITHKLAQNALKYVIYPVDMGIIDLR